MGSLSFCSLLWIKGDTGIRDRKVCLWKFSVCQLIFAAFVFFFSSLFFTLPFALFFFFSYSLSLSLHLHHAYTHTFTHSTARVLILFLLLSLSTSFVHRAESIGWTIFIKSLLFIWVFACKMSWLWWGLLSLYTVDTWVHWLLSSVSSSSFMLFFFSIYFSFILSLALIRAVRVLHEAFAFSFQFCLLMFGGWMDATNHPVACPYSIIAHFSIRGTRTFVSTSFILDTLGKWELY